MNKGRVRSSESPFDGFDSEDSDHCGNDTPTELETVIEVVHGVTGFKRESGGGSSAIEGQDAGGAEGVFFDDPRSTRPRNVRNIRRGP